jgi:ribosomal protein L40E
MRPDSRKCRACRTVSEPWWSRRGVWYRHDEQGRTEWLDAARMEWLRLRNTEACPYCGAGMGLGAERCRACGKLSNSVRGISVFGRRA